MNLPTARSSAEKCEQKAHENAPLREGYALVAVYVLVTLCTMQRLFICDFSLICRLPEGR